MKSKTPSHRASLGVKPHGKLNTAVSHARFPKTPSPDLHGTGGKSVFRQGLPAALPDAEAS